MPIVIRNISATSSERRNITTATHASHTRKRNCNYLFELIYVVSVAALRWLSIHSIVLISSGVNLNLFDGLNCLMDRRLAFRVPLSIASQLKLPARWLSWRWNVIFRQANADMTMTHIFSHLFHCLRQTVSSMIPPPASTEKRLKHALMRVYSCMFYVRMHNCHAADNDWDVNSGKTTHRICCQAVVLLHCSTFVCFFFLFQERLITVTQDKAHISACLKCLENLIWPTAAARGPMSNAPKFPSANSEQWAFTRKVTSRIVNGTGWTKLNTWAGRVHAGGTSTHVPFSIKPKPTYRWKQNNNKELNDHCHSSVWNNRKWS